MSNNNHECEQVETPPNTGWISAYYDCTDTEWRLATTELHTSEEEAIIEAGQWGSPYNVATLLVGYPSWTLWFRGERKGSSK